MTTGSSCMCVFFPGAEQHTYGGCQKTPEEAYKASLRHSRCDGLGVLLQYPLPTSVLQRGTASQNEMEPNKHHHLRRNLLVISFAGTQPVSGNYGSLGWQFSQTFHLHVRWAEGKWRAPKKGCRFAFCVWCSLFILSKGRMVNPGWPTLHLFGTGFGFTHHLVGQLTVSLPQE